MHWHSPVAAIEKKKSLYEKKRAAQASAWTWVRVASRRRKAFMVA